MSIRETGGIKYILTRKKVKNINLRVRPNGEVAVSAPSYVPADRVDAFVLSQAGFIEKARKKFSESVPDTAKPKEYVTGEKLMYIGREITLCVTEGEANAYLDGDILRLSLINTHSLMLRRKAVNDFWNKQCEKYFKELIDRYYPEFEPYGIQYPWLKIRDMKSRWGSCMPSKGVITLNKQLLSVPKECAEYVAVHEFCHFLEANHSDRFYAYVARHMPDWKNRKGKLNKCSINIL